VHRAWFYLWSLVACPLIAWFVAVFGTNGNGGATKFTLIFIGLPALLALVGARLLKRGAGDAIIGAVLAGILGAVAWFLTVLWLASEGVYETRGWLYVGS
jgi:hypothetical protein